MNQRHITAQDIANDVYRGDYVIDLEDAVEAFTTTTNHAKTQHDDIDRVVRRAHESVEVRDMAERRVEIRGVVPDLLRTDPDTSDSNSRVMLHSPRLQSNKAAGEGEYLTADPGALCDTREWQ